MDCILRRPRDWHPVGMLSTASPYSALEMIGDAVESVPTDSILGVGGFLLRSSPLSLPDGAWSPRLLHCGECSPPASPPSSSASPSSAAIAQRSSSAARKRTSGAWPSPHYSWESGLTRLVPAWPVRHSRFSSGAESWASAWVIWRCSRPCHDLARACPSCPFSALL